MNILIWVLQIVLAAMFLMAGFMKVLTPKKKLEEKMTWAKDFRAGTLKFIGIAEILGAAGLILPKLLNIMPVLTSVAAFSLALILLLSIRVHTKLKEQKYVVMNLVFMVLAIILGILT